MNDEEKSVFKGNHTDKQLDRRSSSKRWVILILVCLSTVKLVFQKV